MRQLPHATISGIAGRGNTGRNAERDSAETIRHTVHNEHYQVEFIEKAA